MTAFFVYVDWTTEKHPRPYYVGKGNSGRVRYRKRNLVHDRIAKKHGFRREIALMTSVESITLDVEVQLIAELKTRCGVPGHWGANLTAGGEGLSNPSPCTRVKMSESQRKRCPDTLDTRRRKSESARCLNSRAEVRERKSQFMKGRTRNDEYRANISRAKQRPVEQLNLEGTVVATFDSALQAEQITGVSRTKICVCCKGTRPRAGGYGWRYKVIE